MASRTLLVIAHGSRSSAWNHAIETFCSNLRQAEHGETGIEEVRWCYLEHAQPTIQSTLEHLCKEKQQNIVALPLFLSVGQHVSTDIPNEVQSVAQLVERGEGMSLFDCQGCHIQLLDPPPSLDLIADNIERRVKRLHAPLNGYGLMVIYYGAQKYMRQWNHLAFNVQSRLLEKFPHCQVNWGYGGDAVEFSPLPLAKQLKEMAQSVENIVAVPALVAVGVIQNEIIPAAIEQSHQGEKIIYSGDSILPDSEMERTVLEYVHNKIVQN